MTTFRSPVTGRLFPLQWPIRERPLGFRPTYEVTRRYGDMSIPQYGAHTGIDVGNGFGGDPVVAMADGTVTFAGAHTDGALMVFIDHGSGFQTRSIHLDRIDVVLGQSVRGGEQIGIIGATGLTLLPGGQRANHLHQEAWQDGLPIDPEPLAHGKAFSRLAMLPAAEEADMDPEHDTPVAICRIASGGTLYADRDRREVLVRLWPGGDTIGLYHRPDPAVLPNGKPALARIRVDTKGGAGVTWRDAWIGDDKVRNVRLAAAPRAVPASDGTDVPSSVPRSVPRDLPGGVRGADRFLLERRPGEPDVLHRNPTESCRLAGTTTIDVDADAANALLGLPETRPCEYCIGMPDAED